jgi:hypothetical protein
MIALSQRGIRVARSRIRSSVVMNDEGRSPTYRLLCAVWQPCFCLPRVRVVHRKYGVRPNPETFRNSPDIYVLLLVVMLV